MWGHIRTFNVQHAYIHCDQLVNFLCPKTGYVYKASNCWYHNWDCDMLDDDVFVETDYWVQRWCRFSKECDWFWWFINITSQQLISYKFRIHFFFSQYFMSLNLYNNLCALVWIPRWFLHRGTKWISGISSRDALWFDSCPLHIDQQRTGCNGEIFL